MDFGFTNDLGKLEANRKFRDAAIADGWEATPTYGSHEPMDRHATLCKEGFKMHAMCREKTGKWKAETHIVIWGPDDLQISVPAEYDWNEIKAAVLSCLVCKATGIPTYRVGFAGRSCEPCLPAAREKHEYPGWCN